MFLKNLQQEPLDLIALKSTLANLDDVSVPSEDELEDELGNYYNTALVMEAANANYLLRYDTESLAAAANMFRLNGRATLAKIRKAVCTVINALSTVDEIIEAVLKAISSFIPGGIVVEWVVKRLIKFFINKGYALLCPVPIAA
jgi:hypothetical protein